MNFLWPFVSLLIAINDVHVSIHIKYYYVFNIEKKKKKLSWNDTFGRQTTKRKYNKYVIKNQLLLHSYKIANQFILLCQTIPFGTSSKLFYIQSNPGRRVKGQGADNFTSK